jgi:hypothetical protein
MPTSLVPPNGHRSLQSSGYAYLAVLAVKGSGVSNPLSSTLAPEALPPEFVQVIPEGAGPVNPPSLWLIFLLAVLRLLVGASR